MIKNEVSEDKKKQCQTIDHKEIKQYPLEFQEQICSSIFRNSERKHMHVQKKTVDEHFSDKKPSLGGGRFLKKNERQYVLCSW